MLRRLIKPYIFVAFWTLIASLVLILTGKERAAISAVLGGTFASLIMYFSITVSRAVLDKKSVAIAGGVIVFKYAIFGIILWLVSSNFELDPIGFFAGFFSLIPGLYFVGVFELQQGQREVRIY